MLSKLTDTIKRVANSLANTVFPSVRRFFIAVGKLACNFGRHFVVGIVATGRFFKECFCAFGRLVKGFGGWMATFFTLGRQKGWRTAFITQWNAYKQARVRHEMLFSKGIIVAAPLMLMLLAGITSPVWANLTLAKRVVYAKRILGDISTVETYESAKNYFINSVAVDDGADYIENTRLETVYIVRDHVISAETLAQKMLHNTESLISGFGLYIDGQLTLVSQTAAPFYNQLYSTLEKAKNGNPTAQSEFVQSIEVRDGYFPAGQCADDAAVEVAFTENTLQLSIKTTVTEQHDEPLPYSTNKTNSNEILLGKTKTVTKGKEGVKRITALVTYLDGVEIERVITDTQVVAEPVTEEVLVGTKKLITTVPTSSKVMLWPLPQSVRYVITSDFNEYRDTGKHHGGLDIACSKGTPIFAAMDGTVIEASSSGGYGKHVIIDHGNNLHTLYGHCSVLGVSVGDKVAKGEQIAAVGSTGNSTGPHLHFEVRVNGQKCNPLEYLDK